MVTRRCETAQVYFIKEFQRLKEEDFSKKSLEWNIEQITNLVASALSFKFPYNF